MSRRLAAAFCYGAVFLLQYQTITAPLYGYWGFSPLHLAEALWLLPMMTLPALALPESVDRPSALLAFLNYAVLYVPLCVLLFHSTKTVIAAPSLWAIWATLALAAVVLGLLPRWEAAPLKLPGPSRTAVLTLCWCAVGVVVAAALSVTRLHGSDIQHTAVARRAYSADVVSLGPWFRYADYWAGLAFIPFLFSDALRKRSWTSCLALAGVCGLMYLMSGRKTVLFCPVAVLVAHGALKRRAGPEVLLLALGVLLLVPLALKALTLAHLARVAAMVVNFRIFAVPQILVPQYYAYYAAQGFTCFRHVGLVNRLCFGGRPFELPLHAIARFYYHKTFTADAMPYATDGLAALGILGVPLITALLALVFHVFDRVARRHSPLLVLPAMMPFLFSMFNNSLFTSLLTGGGLVLMLLFAVFPDGA